MHIDRTRIEQAAHATGIDVDDLAAFFAQGEERTYAPGEWLFQQSTPRRWAGILLTGAIEIVRGLHGASRHVATMNEGSLISEGLLLDDDAHANGAFTRGGATVWQISRERLLAFRDRCPPVYYRIVSRVAVSINRRRRLLAESSSFTTATNPVWWVRSPVGTTRSAGVIARRGPTTACRPCEPAIRHLRHHGAHLRPPHRGAGHGQRPRPRPTTPSANSTKPAPGPSARPATNCSAACTTSSRWTCSRAAPAPRQHGHRRGDRQPRSRTHGVSPG